MNPAAGKNLRQSDLHFERNLRLVSSVTAASRLTGYFRDMLNASLFGAGWISDAYFAASRIPNFMQNLVSDGALLQAFVPTFSKILGKNKPKEAQTFMSQMFTFVLMAAGAITVLGMVFSEKIVTVVAYGFTQQPEKFHLAAKLTLIIFPVFLLACMASLWMGILNSLHRFVMPAAATLAMNATLIMTGLALWAGNRWGGWGLDTLTLVTIWTAATIPGMFLQWAVQWPEAARLGFRLRLAWPSHPAMKEALHLMAFALLSQSVLQINFLVNQFFASFLPNGYVTYIYYGTRLMQLPFGVLGVSIATISFPILSQQAGRIRLGEFGGTLTRSLESAVFSTLPATVGLILISEPLCRLAFQHGALTAEDSHRIAQATSLYLLGLVSSTCSKILMTAYYAKQKPRLPLWASMVSFFINLLINGSLFLFAKDGNIRFWGLALSASLCSFLNLGILLSGLPAMGVRLDWRRLGRSLVYAFGRTLAMALAVEAALRTLLDFQPPGAVFWNAALPALLGAGVYLGLARLGSGLKSETGRKKTVPHPGATR